MAAILKQITMPKQTITINTKEENPEPLDLIADSIVKLSDGVEKMQSSRLNKRAIVVLLKDQTGISMRDIETILDACVKMKDVWIKKIASPSKK